MAKKHRVLVTGGAGFIGSNLVASLLEQDNIELVRVLDNFATGHRGNLSAFENNPKFEFLWGDIREYSTCLDAAKGMTRICHQAALGSVPRSIKNPLTSNNVNITGTLNIFTAAKELGIKRVVYAASSSTYGDSPSMPKREDVTGNPISPYAVTKLVNELYAKVYGSLYDVDFIGLRYFNVFGPKQDPNGAYAAVIPLFAKAIIENKSPTINGDGLTSRDFTYIENVVQANIKALFTENESALNEVYNIAVGDRTTLLDLIDMLNDAAGKNIKPIHGPTRAGDVKHSLADISKAKNYLGYKPQINVREGIKKVYEWYLSENK